MIDVDDARALADQAMDLVDAGEAQIDRAAALLMNAALMLYAEDFPASDIVARGIAWCRRENLCPCKMVVTGPLQQHQLGQIVGIDDLIPAWVRAAELVRGQREPDGVTDAANTRHA